jgi:HD-GYP domain-containing protein (c-di-GMP phosphodiesterase class II)
LLRAVQPLQGIAVGAAAHHERRDGSGYPWRWPAARIPRAGQWLAVADVFDALVAARPYKPPWGPDAAVRVLRDGAGRAFDPEAVEALAQWVRNGGPDRLPAAAGPVGGRGIGAGDEA